MEQIKRKERKKANNKLKTPNIILILGLVYTLITILAIISYVSRIKEISTTVVTFGTVIGDVWWQILMIVLFAICYILYKRRHLFGILLEIIMAMSMLVYIVISVATMGINFIALLIELIYPLVLAFHGLMELKKINKQKSKKRKRIMSTI